MSTFLSVCALGLPGRLSTVPNFTSSLFMLFFVQPLFRNSVINCQALWPLHYFHFCKLLIKILPSLLSGIKVAAFAWYSVKIRVIFGVRFERRKVDKKSKPTWNWNMQTLFWRLLNISAIYCQNRSLQFRAIGLPFQSRAVFWDTVL